MDGVHRVRHPGVSDHRKYALTTSPKLPYNCGQQPSQKLLKQTGKEESWHMKGQWLGEYAGTNTGLITLNLDEGPDGYEGYAHLLDTHGHAPIMMAILKSTGKANPFSMVADPIICVDPNNHATLPPDFLSKHYPGMIFPKSATVTGRHTDRTIELEWKTDIGTHGTGTLQSGNAGDPSDYIPTEMSWAEFKTHIGTYPARKFIYRGQEKPWRLRTSFHRAGRADVFQFEWQDIPALYRVLSSKTKHIYNLGDGAQNGAFWHLVQHHGYPTPLLDWTYSPFVAAFCAFRKISPGELKDGDKVRIFMFDHVKWHSVGHWERLQTLRTHKLHLSVLDFISIDNDRVIPQQALSCVTNIDDVESYVRKREEIKDTTYMRVFDIPASERNKAMTDLSVMGITAGSMFPGLDGMCEEIKERMFNPTW